MIKKEKMEHELVGEKHLQLAQWLAGDWLEKGPRVFVIEGFPGVGKTAVARKTKNILEHNKRKISIVHIDMPETLSHEMDELKLEIATGLEEARLVDASNDVLDSDLQGLWRILERVLYGEILVIIDEFQRYFSPLSARPPKPLEDFFYRVSRNDNLPGRLLLISSRQLDRDKWSGFFKIKFLEGVSGQKGIELLEYMLEAEGCLEEVSVERRPDIVKCLGGNPRAMRLLAASLKFDSLDELMGAAPELWTLDKREFSPELLQKLERALLERALNHLSNEEVKALRILSVYS